MMHADPARLATAPLLARFGDQRIEGHRSRRRLAHLFALEAAHHLAEVLHDVAGIAHLRGGRHVGRNEDRHAGVGQHQMERKTDHAEQVVRIEPGTLAVGLGPQGEEILEDAPMDDHPRHQRDEHEHAGQADDVHADVTGVQVVVQLEEELATQRFRHWLGLRAARVEGDVVDRLGGVYFPTESPVRLALGRAVHPEGMQLLADVLLQPATHIVRTEAGYHAVMQRRAHPAGEFLVEAGDGAGKDDHEQQPARQQAAPGVQTGHALAQFHGRTLQSPEKNAARHSTAVTPTINSHTRVALRAANT